MIPGPARANVDLGALQAQFVGSERWWLDFRRKLSEYQNGGIARTSARAIGRAVDAGPDDLEACPDWPQEPIDDWISVSPKGRAESIELRPSADQSFESCVRSVLSANGFPEGDQRQTAVIQLIGFHEEGLVAEDPVRHPDTSP